MAQPCRHPILHHEGARSATSSRIQAVWDAMISETASQTRTGVDPGVLFDRVTASRRSALGRRPNWYRRASEACSADRTSRSLQGT